MRNQNSPFDSKTFFLSPAALARARALQKREKVIKVFATIIMYFLLIMAFTTLSPLADYGLPLVWEIIFAVAMIVTFFAATIVFLFLFYIFATISFFMSWAHEGLMNSYSLLFLIEVVLLIVFLILSQKYENY